MTPGVAQSVASPTHEPMRLNSRHLLAAALVGLALASPAAALVPVAGQNATPDEAGRFRFIGASTAGRHPFALLEARDVELLMELGEPLTPNEFLQRGLPLRTSQLATLQRLGFLVQEGDRFRSAFPILRGAQAEALAEILATAADAMIAGARSELASLRVALGTERAHAAFAAVCSWMLREAVWARLQDSGVIDIGNVVALGRAQQQTRGWWGVLWFSDLGVHPYDFASARHDNRTVQLVWNRNAGELLVNPQAAEGSLAHLLRDTRDRGRRVRHPENFLGLQRYGVLNADGWLTIPMLEWKPERQGSPAAAVERAIDALAASFDANMPWRELVVQLRLPPTEVAAIAYSELQPFLVDALIAAEFPIQLGGQLLAVGPGEDSGPIRVQLSGQAPPRPPAAGVVWTGYKGRRPQYELPASDFR